MKPVLVGLESNQLRNEQTLATLGYEWMSNPLLIIIYDSASRLRAWRSSWVCRDSTVPHATYS